MGAIALVVLIVIVLPIVLDTEPSPVGQDLVVQIPSQEAGKFNTRVLTPSAPGAATPPGDTAPGKSEALTPGAAPKDPKADAKAAAKTAPPAVAAEGDVPSALASARIEPPSPAKDASDAARAKALLEGKEAWVVRLGAFSNQDNVRQLQAKLAAAGVKSYTETGKGPKGDQTRVRAGPFDSKLEAEQAHEKIAAMGIRPGTVAAQ